MTANKDNIGKYISRYGYSDVNIVGKIIGISGKKTYVVKRVNATRQITALDFQVGGFSAICTNQYNQVWQFEETEEMFNVKVLKNSRLLISDNPTHFYDYNF